LLTYSRRQVLQPKVLNLNQLLAGMEAMLRRLIGEDIELHFAPARDIGQISADPGQIEQVVMNLAVNARDAMPRGGILTIETGAVELDGRYAATLPAMKPGKYVVLAVGDNGTGMDAETRAHLFEPFFTTKAQGQGTGLGMTTVFGIVKQSGGAMHVASEPGQGTSVKVYLPSIDRPAAVEMDAPVARAARGSETILLVEDDEQVRNLIRDTLPGSWARHFWTRGGPVGSCGVLGWREDKRGRSTELPGKGGERLCQLRQANILKMPVDGNKDSERLTSVQRTEGISFAFHPLPPPVRRAYDLHLVPVDY